MALSGDRRWLLWFLLIPALLVGGCVGGMLDERERKLDAPPAPSHRPADRSSTSSDGKSEEKPFDAASFLGGLALIAVGLVGVGISATSTDRDKGKDGCGGCGCVLMIAGVSSVGAGLDYFWKMGWFNAIWHGVGVWQTLLFVLAWPAVGIVWARRQIKRHGSMEGFTRRGAVFACVPLVLGVWLLGWLGAGLSPVLGPALDWLGGAGPWTEEVGPVMALLLAFVALRVLLLPFHLSHDQIDPRTGRTQSWREGGSFSHRAMLSGAAAFVLEAVFLLWVATAADEPLGPPPVEHPNASKFDPESTFQPDAPVKEPDEASAVIVRRGPGNWTRLVYVLGATALGAGWIALEFRLIGAFYDRARRRLPYGARLHRRDWEVDWGYVLAQEMFLYLPTLFLLTAWQRDNPWLLTVIVCFTVSKALMTGVAELASWHLDWRADLKTT